jgi:hypothetical protein
VRVEYHRQGCGHVGRLDDADVDLAGGAAGDNAVFDVAGEEADNGAFAAGVCLNVT